MKTFHNFEFKSSSVKTGQISWAVVMAPNKDIAYRRLVDYYHETVAPVEQYTVDIIQGPAIIAATRESGKYGS